MPFASGAEYLKKFSDLCVSLPLWSNFLSYGFLPRVPDNHASQ